METNPYKTKGHHQKLKMIRTKYKKSINYPIHDEPIVLSKALLDTLLKQKKPSDLISLYSFYYYTAKWQHTPQPYATTSYTAKGLSWSQDHVRKTKQKLITLKLIEDIISKNKENGKINGHYIKVNFIWSQSKAEKHHPHEKPYYGENHTMENHEINALNINNLNALNTNIPPSWKSLSKIYGQSQVKFVKWFLKIQQKNFPKRIPGKITAIHERVINSLIVLDKLCRIDGYDFETEVRPILEKVPGDSFWARNLLSLASLRNVGSNGEKKFTNIATHFDTGEPAISPEEILLQHFGRQRDWFKYIYQPARNLFELCDGKTEARLAHAICTIDMWYNKKHPTKNVLIPDSFLLIEQYVIWLDKEQWITNINPTNFDPTGKMFQMFLHQYQKELGINFFADILPRR